MTSDPDIYRAAKLLIDQHGEMQGVMTAREALIRAYDVGLDLVEISPNAVPPVCKILDYGKYKFQEQKKKAEARKRQKVVEVKEIKLRPNIDIHDYDVKMRSIRRFFEEGDKVKVTMRFRGGEMRHPELGMKLLQQVKLDFERETRERKNEIGQLEKRLLQKEDALDRKTEAMEARAQEAMGMRGRARDGSSAGPTCRRPPCPTGSRPRRRSR